MMIQDIAILIAQILLGAAIGEAVVEFLIAPLLDIWEANGLDLGWKGVLTRTISTLFGIIIALEYWLNLPGLIGMVPRHAWFGVVLTGILLGRGANWVHSFIEKWISNAAAKKAEAVMAIRSAQAFKESC